MSVLKESILCLLLIASVLTLGLTAFAEGLVLDKDTYELFQESKQLFDAGQYEVASQKYKQLIELLPNESSLHTNLMFCLTKMGRTNEALVEAIAAVKVDPTCSLCVRNLGNAYQITGHREKAIEIYSQYLDQFPKGDERSTVKALIKELRTTQVASTSSSNTIRLGTGAYTKWRRTKMPLKVFIASGESVQFYNEGFRTAVEEAFQNWADASEQRVAFQFVNKKPYDILCYFESQRTKATRAEEGRCQSEYDQSGMLTSVKILLLTTNTDGTAMSIQKMKETALHEIGHGLGIVQHSNDPHDIMFYSTHGQESAVQLSERDKETLKKLYDRKDPPIQPDLPTMPPIQFFH